jgi:hypothetical protein
MHLMIDLETGGTTPGSAIFSIGACLFNPYTADKPVHTFYEEISHSSCMELGLKFQRDTMDWWAKQGTPPNGTTHIKQVLENFNLWLSNAPSKCNEHIIGQWANSPSFDLNLIKHVMDIYKIRWPYPYWQELDVRTLKAIAFPNGDYKLNNSHNALDDCINQAQLVQHAFITLGLSKHEDKHDSVPSGNQR